MEIKDFAAALRQMAANADDLADRHDVAKMASLRSLVEAQTAKADRDSDLIDELRRQVSAMGRMLDAIGRTRKNVMFGDKDAVQVLTEALLVIAGEVHCESFMSPGSCRTAGRTRGARYTDDAWCATCVARDALERAGALPSAVD